MRLFAMPDIGGGFRDLWDYMRTDRPHRWTALGLAITIPLVVFYFILRSVYHQDAPKRSILYVQSWPADRSEFDVRHDWLVRAREANDRNERRRDAYGSFARALGQDYDKGAAHDEFDEARATIDQALRDLEEARAAGRPIPPLPRAQPEAPPAPAAPAAQ
ncbi:MAG: hypothetical protein ABL882_05840 [Sphingopyxis sp.]